jgi:hypothetical protein
MKHPQSKNWNRFNCSQFNSNRLEKVQLEAARIVCGFPSYASIASIYKETGWDKLKVRFWKYIWRIFDLNWAKIGICRIFRSKVFHSLLVEGKKDWVEINVDTLLFGNYFLSDETNCEIFLSIQRYINDTGHFSV